MAQGRRSAEVVAALVGWMEGVDAGHYIETGSLDGPQPLPYDPQVMQALAGHYIVTGD